MPKAKKPKPSSEDAQSVYTAIRVPKGLLERAKAKAKRQRRTFANHVCILLELDLGDLTPEELTYRLQGHGDLHPENEVKRE